MATPMWLRAAGYWGYQYKRTWKSSIATSFLIPILYLAAMGIALGSLIDKHSHGVGGVSYLATSPRVCWPARPCRSAPTT